MGEAHERYLRVLGFDRPPEGLHGLRELVARHLCRVPFENVSKLLLIEREGAGRMTRLSEFLDGIEHCDLGGTCYTCNPFLAELLRALGYDADLLGADMSTPNVHTSIRVRVAGIAYHVDVGYAGPFREPMRLDGVPHAIEHGPYRYVFDRRRGGEEYEMGVYRGEERIHGYIVHDAPRALDFFQPIILESFRRGTTFMSCLRITRFFERHTVELRDRVLFRYRDGESSETELKSLAELRAAINDEFRMPRCPIEEAVAILERMTGTHFRIW